VLDSSSKWLVYLYGAIDFPHKNAGAKVPHGATHKTEADTKHCHVAKIKRGLKQSIHFGLEEEIVEGVEVDIASCRASREERCPLPPIILSIE
jgi:hypothetical protein